MASTSINQYRRLTHVHTIMRSKPSPDTCDFCWTNSENDRCHRRKGKLKKILGSRACNEKSIITDSNGCRNKVGKSYTLNLRDRIMRTPFAKTISSDLFADLGLDIDPDKVFGHGGKRKTAIVMEHLDPLKPLEMDKLEWTKCVVNILEAVVFLNRNYAA